MATIHRTTMAPTKLELVASWLPGQAWYGGTATPDLVRAGGFRLDDPAGDVGIELMLVTDRSGSGSTTYFVPVTYRGAPLAGADGALLGTSEHGVLGTRWIYDAEHDPVATAQLLALVTGDAEAQHQDDSDTPDPTVGRSWTGQGDRPAAVELVRVPVPGPAGTGRGRVEAEWSAPEGSRVRGVVAVVR